MAGNQNMYMYGLVAKAIQFVGVILLLISFGAFTASVVAGWILLILSIAIIIKGKAMRFDYKRQSGSIIHKGDF